MTRPDLPTHTAGPGLSETALDSELFDQPPPTGPPVRYFILSARRSGSYMLCRALIRAGVGVPHEYFLRDHARLLASRWGVEPGARRGPSSRAYLGALLQRRSCGGFFGAKVQYWQYARALRSAQGDEFLDGARLIYLYREDLLKQAVSFRHAEITGRWGSEDAVTTRPREGADPFDPRAIDRKISLLLHDELGWRSFLARAGRETLHLSYEALCADPAGSLAAVAGHLGVDAGRLAGLEPEPRSPQLARDAELKAGMLAAYLDRSRKLARAGPWAGPIADAVWAAWGRFNDR